MIKTYLELFDENPKIKIVSPLDNWGCNTNRTDHQILLELIKKFNIKSFLEIGTFNGNTANIVISHPQIEKVATVDVRDRIAELLPEVMYFKNTEEIPDEYEMVFIDGEHTYEGVAEDYNKILRNKPKIIAFHDCQIEGVMCFVKGLKDSGKKVEFIQGNALIGVEEVTYE